jgi:hypothetical protein
MIDHKVGRRRGNADLNFGMGLLVDMEWRENDFIVYAPETGQNGVHRVHLSDERVKLVHNEKMSFGNEAEQIEQIGAGVKRFHDSTTATASALVGCFGIRSNRRVILLGVVNPSICAYRGLILMLMARAVELLGDN